MEIFVDLDETLFDTSRLDVYLGQRVEKDWNVNLEDYRSAHIKVFAVNAGIYSPLVLAGLLADITGKNKEALTAYFKDLFAHEDSATYLFADAINFLNSCSKIGRVIILSFGEDFVQIPRIIKCGLPSLVNDVIVTQGVKAEEIQKYLNAHSPNNDRVALIDDSLKHLGPVKERFLNSITIHIVRKSEMVTPPEHHQAASLTEAFDILKKYK